MNFIYFLLFYLCIGFAWLGFMDLVNRSTKSVEPFSIDFSIINIVLWPISFILFCYSLFKGLFFDK